MTETRPRRRRRGVDDSRMTLVEHLLELRSRLVISLAALFVGVIVAFVFFGPIFRVLQQPFCDLPPEIRQTPTGECRLYYFGVLDGFLVRLQISLIVGALLASPIWLYHLAAFVTPGLHSRERRWAYPFVGISLVLFAVGAVFAYLTMDRGLRFLFSIAGDEIVPILDVKKYLSFFTLTLLAFGVSFEFPLLLVFLTVVGVVDADKLRRWRRAMVFGVAVFTAVITPSQDPFTFLAMWLPMVIFYEAAVLFARAHARSRRRRDATAGTNQWADDETSPVDESPSPIDV